MSIIWARLDFKGRPKQTIQIEQFKKHFAHITINKTGLFHNDKLELVNLLQHNSQESLAEKLPFKDAGSNVVITADCRIDNRKELIKLLNIKDAAVPDSQLILKSYLQYGDKCVQHLIGAYSFIIWDPRNQQLFCARDHMGVRPFYYYQDNKQLIISSEKKGILMVDGIDDAINESYIINMLSSQNNSPEATCYTQIKRLLPAHTLKVKNQNSSIAKYWDLDVHTETYYPQSEDYVSAFNEKMREAVDCRIRSHNQVGAELSGGLDSSGITVLAHQSLKTINKEIYTFSASLPEKRRKDYEFKHDYDRIVEICERWGIQKSFHFSKPRSWDLNEVTDLNLTIYDGIDEKGQSGSFSMKEKAQSLDVGVMLSGFPGDELVSSYANAHFLTYIERNHLYSFYKNGLKRHSFRHLMLYTFYHYLARANQSFAKSIVNTFSSKKVSGLRARNNEIATFFNQQYLDRHPNVARARYIQSPTPPALSFRESQRNLLLRPHTSFRMENENICAQHLGMEVRYPMADIRLLQYVLSVPMEQKINAKYDRLLYRRSLKGILPDHIRWRTDEAFATNPSMYINNEIFHYKKIEFYKNLRNTPNLDFLDIDKLLRLNEMLYNKAAWKKGTYAGGDRISNVFLIARFAQLNEEFRLK